MCQSRLYREEKDNMHRSHQYLFPAICSGVIGFKVALLIAHPLYVACGLVY